MLNAIEEHCKKFNQKYIKIDGSVNGRNRQEMIVDYENDDSIKVAILSITAAS
jgi:SNF2 family DNA or RNA helicase